MNTSPPEIHAYLLVDNAMLEESSRHAEANGAPRPEWLVPIYHDKALMVSPLLIDIDSAYQAGDLDRVMGLVNARTPALHLMLLETALSQAELAAHLRRFIFVVAEDNAQYTLRFADCAVLTPLSTILTAAQWATLMKPIIRWCVHERTGLIWTLSPADPALKEIGTPLHLTDQQVDLLTEALEPDHFLAKVRMMRHGAPLPGALHEQYEWARKAREVWRGAGNTNNVMLTFLTEAALESHGEILDRRSLPELLGQGDLAAFRASLRAIVEEIGTRRLRRQAMAIEQAGTL